MLVLGIVCFVLFFLIAILIGIPQSHGDYGLDFTPIAHIMNLGFWLLIFFSVGFFLK